MTGFNSEFNPLNAKLNPICHLLALLGAHHIFDVRGLRVKGLTRVSPAFWTDRDAELDEVRAHQLPPETPRLVAHIRFALFNFVINHGASSRHQDYGHTIPCSSHAKLHALKQHNTVYPV